MTLQYNHPQIDERPVKWIHAKAVLQTAIDSKYKFGSDEEYSTEVVELMEMCERIKQSLVDKNLVVKNDSNQNFIQNKGE